jgi:4'-phosphopantetheinyl transferase
VTWDLPPRFPRLASRDVHVWRLPRSADRSETAAAPVLSSYLGVDPGAVPFRRDRSGKPVLAGPHVGRLHFNVSHGGRFLLLAVSRSSQVGVDVEPLRAPVGGWTLLRHVLAPAERQALLTDADGEPDTFLQVWVRKEALLKAAATGLSVEPNLLELRGTSIVSLPPALGDPSRWSVVDLPLSGHVGALAVEGAEPRVSLFA